eukprot:scaffold39849_cov56-Phaeocystis_antarctica.AAC.3
MRPRGAFPRCAVREATSSARTSVLELSGKTWRSLAEAGTIPIKGWCPGSARRCGVSECPIVGRHCIHSPPWSPLVGPALERETSRD